MATKKAAKKAAKSKAKKTAKRSAKRAAKTPPSPSGTVAAGSPPVGGTTEDTAEPVTPAPGTPLRSSSTTESYLQRQGAARLAQRKA